MDSSQVKKFAKRAVAHGAGWCATFASVQTVVSHPTLNAALLAGAAFAAAACVAGALAYAAVWAQSRRPRTEYRAQPVQPADLEHVYRLGVKWFGKKVSGLERMKQWHAAYPGVIAKVVAERHYGARRVTDLVGYYCALPISESAANDILAGRRGITDVGAHELSPRGEVPSAIYIGAIATGVEASGAAALRGLLAAIRLMGKRRQNVQIITRPVTADGLALVEKFGMKVVGPAGPAIGSLYTGRLGQLATHRQRSKG